ncbi:MAG TPA: cytochrome P450, partial [Pseudonocardia sp.]
GLPAEDLQLLLAYKDAMLADQFSPDPAVREHFKAATVPEITEYLRGHVERRRDRATAPDDFFTRIVHAQFRGERPLTISEIVDIVAQHVQAALDTTTGQLCLHMAWFAGNQDRWRELRQHPERIPGAIEELLRHNAIVTPGRLVTRDTVIGGVPMRAGDLAAVVLPAAGRDEDAFPDAAVVDFQRTPNRHLTFGGGPHMCVGANLARFQLRIAYEELTRSLPAFRIAEGSIPQRVPGIVMGMRSLELERTDR